MNILSDIYAVVCTTWKILFLIYLGLLNASNKAENLPSSPDCGFSNVTNRRVVGGSPVLIGEYPWIVTLGYKRSENSFMKWKCGGSLITKIHVLTAAHCIKNQNVFLVRIGDNNLYSDDDDTEPEDIPIRSKIIHENYNGIEYSYDIAILKLKRAVTHPGAWPICLPLAENMRSKSFVKYQPVVAGWGTDSYDGQSSSILQKVTVPVVSNEECKRSYEKYQNFIIDEKILCAGYPNGRKDACKGDSGGPLMVISSENQNVRVTQIGIVSYGLKCAEAGFPGIYTRVTYYIDWIKRHVQ